MKNRFIHGLLLICSPIFPIIAAAASEAQPQGHHPSGSPMADSTWDLSHVFASDEEWEDERERFADRLEEARRAVEDWTASPSQMLQFLELDCSLERAFFRLIYYADLNIATHENEPRFKDMQGRMLSLFGTWQSIMAPMDSQILELGEERFEEYLATEPGLLPHAFKVRGTYREETRALPPEASRLVGLSRPLTLQPRMTYQALLYSDLPWADVTLSDGTTHSLDYPTYSRLLGSENAADRRLVRESYRKSLASYRNTFAALMNSEIQSQHFLARARNFESALEARFLSDNLDPAVFTLTVEMAREHLPLYHRYLELKKRLAGLEPFRVSDLFAPARLVTERNYTFQEARTAVQASLEILGKEYSEGVRRAFEERWFDVYPANNKRGFGGVTQVYGLHPYILLNFTGTYRDVNVVTHELGHAIQFWLIDRHHPCVNSSTSSFLFEMAAHFNEHLLVDQLLEEEQDRSVRLFILTRHLESLTAALFGQARLAEFEHDMHLRVEGGGTLTADWLTERYLELSREYQGHDRGLVIVDETEGFGWIGVDQLFKSYYVVNYASGMVAALAFKNMVDTQGATGVERYVDFLRSGGTDDPLVLLEKAGVDLTIPETYRAAFRQFEALVAELESALTKLEAKS
jgi:oligoendopeptidase F